MRTKAPRTSAPERVFALQNQLEDFRLTKKQSIVYFHWTMQDFDNADHYELLETLSAKEKKDRVVDPLAFVQSIRKG